MKIFYRPLGLAILLIAASSALYGQTEVTRHSIYFAFDQWTINAEEESRIDSLIRLLRGEVQEIILVGHTDSIGSLSYNWELSEKRVLAIKELLLQKGFQDALISVDSQGETAPVVDNQSALSRQRNRRVEMVIRSFSPLEEPVPPSVHIEESTSGILPSPPKGDTILKIDGARIVLSKADFYKFEDCLRIRPVLSGTDARELDLTTITTENDLLVSCGMIDLQLDPPCTGCFDKPIKVQFPVNVSSKCDVCRQRRVYDVAEGNRWSERPNERIRKVQIDGRYYYEMLIECPGTKNCDCKQNGQPVKFKVPRKYTIQKLQVVYDCPIANYAFSYKKNKASGQLPCILTDKEAFVYLTATRGEETIQLDHIPLTEFEHAFWKKCKAVRGENRLLFFRTWEYKTYSKYRIDIP